MSSALSALVLVVRSRRRVYSLPLSSHRTEEGHVGHLRWPRAMAARRVARLAHEHVQFPRPDTWVIVVRLMGRGRPFQWHDAELIYDPSHGLPDLHAVRGELRP